MYLLFCFLLIITTEGRFEQLKELLGSYEAGVFLFGVVGTWYVIGKSFDIFIEKQTFATALITLLCGGVWGLTFIGVSVFLVPFIVMGMFVCILWSFKNKWSREDKVAYSAVLYLCILLFVGIGYGLNWLGELIEAEKESKRFLFHSRFSSAKEIPSGRLSWTANSKFWIKYPDRQISPSAFRPRRG